ncbi:MAG: tetratricopeptide repeat protein [Bacteriodetes bacterium]|nr:tetratricopeptide repeat protein [Bacteroidota bacterium]
MKTQLHILFICCVIFTLCNTYTSKAQPDQPQTPPSTPKGEKYAIVMATNRYIAFRTLNYAEEDARLIKKIIEDDSIIGIGETKSDTYNKHCYFYLDTNVTPSNFSTALKQIGNQIAQNPNKLNHPPDTLFFYFSGHGFFDEENDLYYLCGYNAEKTGTTAVWELKTLWGRLNKFAKSCNTVVNVVIDACHSGGVHKASINGEDKKPQCTFIISTKDTSSSFEDKCWGGGHGVFTYYLARGIVGEADEDKNGVIQLSELKKYLNNSFKSDKCLNQIGNGKIQKPSILTNNTEDGDELVISKSPVKSLVKDFVLNLGKENNPSIVVINKGDNDDKNLKKSVDSVLTLLESDNKILSASQVRYDYVLEHASSEYQKLSARNFLQNQYQRYAENSINAFFHGDITRDYGTEFKQGSAYLDSAMKLLPETTEDLIDLRDFMYGYAIVYNSDSRLYYKSDSLFKECVKRKPQFTYPYYGLAVLNEERCLYDTAEKLFRKCIALSPEWMRPYNSLAQMYRDRHYFKQGLALADTAIKRDSVNPNPYITKANCLLDLGHYKQAEEAYNKALQLNNNRNNNITARIKRNLGICYREREANTTYRKYLKESFEADSTYIFTLQNLAELSSQDTSVYHGIHTWNTYYKKILSLPETAEKYYVLGSFNQWCAGKIPNDKGDSIKRYMLLDTAKRYLVQSIDLDTFNVDAYKKLFWTYWDYSYYAYYLNDKRFINKNDADAFQVISKIDTLSKNHVSEIQYAIGYYYFWKKADTTKAIEYYKKALQLEPGYYSPIRKLEEIYSKYDSAILQMYYMADSTNCSPVTSHELAMYYERIGKQDSAMRNYKNCIVLDSSYFKVYPNLAILSMANDVEKTLEYCKTYMKHKSDVFTPSNNQRESLNVAKNEIENNRNVERSLSDLLLAESVRSWRLKRFGECLRYAEVSFELNQNNTNAILQLAKLYYMMNDRHKLYEIITSIKINNENIFDADQKIMYSKLQLLVAIQNNDTLKVRKCLNYLNSKDGDDRFDEIPWLQHIKRLLDIASLTTGNTKQQFKHIANNGIVLSSEMNVDMKTGQSLSQNNFFSIVKIKSKNIQAIKGEFEQSLLEDGFLLNNNTRRILFENDEQYHLNE